MGETTRFCVSLDEELLNRFLRMTKKHRYANRSEALRDAMRDALVREEWKGNDDIVGTITIVYDHHKHELARRLTKVQHDFGGQVLANLHIHLDHDNCLEVIAVRGKGNDVQQIADALISTRGVKHGKLTATTTGKILR